MDPVGDSSGGWGEAVTVTHNILQGVVWAAGVTTLVICYAVDKGETRPVAEATSFVTLFLILLIALLRSLLLWIIRRRRRESPHLLADFKDVALDSGDVCGICREDFEAVNKVVPVRTCRHVFHPHCIFLWFRRSNLCPICRGVCSAV